MADRQKLAQLSRRIKAAKARYKSLEKRSGVIEEKRMDLESRAQLIFENLYSSKGKSATPKQRHAWNARFNKAKREAARLQKLETRIYEQLKPLEEKIATLADNLRKVRQGKKLNPGRQHLLGATAKQQRQYEHVLASELASGFSLKDAKAIAAATVRGAKNPYYLVTGNKKAVTKIHDLIILKADRATDALAKGKALYAGKGYTNMKAKKQRNPSPAQIRARKAFAKMAKKRSRLARAKKRNPSATQTLKKAGRAAKKAVRSTLDAGSKLLKAGAKALNPTKRIKVRNSYIDLVIRGTAKKTPQGWKVGRKTVAQGRGTAKLSSGYYLDKATGAVYAKRQRANPKRKRNLDHRDSSHQVKVHQHWRAGGLSQWQRAHHAGQHDLFAHGIKAKPKRNRSRKRNASPKSIRKKFAGRLGAGKTLYFPQGTPQGLAKLGRLTLIKTRGGTIKPSRKNPSGEVWLCADTHGKLHLGTTSNAPLFAGGPQSLGEVIRIEYDESKPHLGYPNPITWFHKLGEESGKRPTLYADGKGGLKFRGGAYKIKREGIVN